jgi:PAS domain S-box-containing protein
MIAFWLIKPKITCLPSGAKCSWFSVKKKVASPMSLSLSDVVENLGDYTLDAILVTKAEPLDWPDGPEIVWCNKTFTRMTGYQLSEIVGKTPRLLQGPLTSREEMAALGRKLRRWESCQVDLYNYRKDGTGFWVELSIMPVADEKGWFRYWVSVQREISDRKDRELEIQRANEAIKEYQKDLEAFSYAAFHDLRSPLRKVAGMLEIIKEDKEISRLSEETQELMNIAQERINSMRNLVKDISTYVADKNIGSSSLSTLYIHDFLFEIFNDIDGSVHNNLNLFSEIEQIQAPSNEFKSIFTNLFENAIKHNKGQNVTIDVAIYERPGHVLIYVDDNGIGIPDEEHESVFSLFVKGKQAQSSEGSGFGLGFVRQLATRNGGAVHVENSPLGGARFVIKWMIN